MLLKNRMIPRETTYVDYTDKSIQLKPNYFTL